MAQNESFEPNVPKEQPADYVFWPRPGSEHLIADTGKGRALSGAGNLLDKAAQTAVGITNTNIEGDVARGVDKILDDWHARLQPVYDTVTGQTKDFDVLSPESGDKQVPANLQKRIQGFDKLDAVMQSGKYSPVYVKNQVDLLAKDIRGDHPGFREEVDKATNEKFQRGIANKSIEAMQSVINSYISKRDEYKNKLDAALISDIHNGNLDAVPVAKLRQQGKYSDEDLEYFLAKSNSQKRTLELLKAKRESQKDDLEEAKRTSGLALNTWMANKQDAYLHTMKISVTGIGNATVDDLVNVINDPNVTQVHRNAAAEGIKQLQGQFYREAVAYANEKRKDGSTIAKDLGGYDQIEKNMPVFDYLAKSLGLGDYTAFKHTAHTIEGKVEDTTNQLTDGDMSGYLLTNAAISKLGQNNTKFMDTYTIGMGLGNADVPDKMKPFVEHRNMQIVTQAGTFNGVPLVSAAKPIGGTTMQGTPLNPGSTLTFQKVLEDSTKRMNDIGIKSDSKAASNVYAAELKPLELITKKETPPEAKKNILAATVGTDINKTFKPDSQDANGNPLLGAETVYTIMTTPNMDKEIFTNPIYSVEERKRYVDWKTSQFVGNQGAFANAIRTLNDVADDPHIQIGWNDTTHQLTLKPVTRDDPSEGQLQMGTPNWQVTYGRVNDVIWRLNMGLSNLANMSKYTKQDPNEFIAQVLSQNHGLRGPIMDKIRAGVTTTLGQQDDTRVQ